jgi:hypothetical protein
MRQPMWITNGLQMKTSGFTLRSLFSFPLGKIWISNVIKCNLPLKHKYDIKYD